MVNRFSTTSASQSLGSPSSTNISKLTGTQIINAIADLALAARAGTLLRIYEREWGWMDKQNNVDPVDADVFNDTFHSIEREFDKLAEILAQTNGSLPPPYDSGEVAIQSGQVKVLTHNLNSMNLLVDLKAKLPQQTIQQILQGAKNTDVTSINADGGWTDIGLGSASGFGAAAVAQPSFAYILPNPNQIMLIGSFGADPPQDLIVRALLWNVDI